MTRERDGVHPPALDLIRSALGKSKKKATGMALLAGFGCGLGLALRLGHPFPLWEPLNLVLAAGLITAAGIAWMEKLRHDTAWDDLVNLLVKHPERLVWVYYLNVQIQPFGVHVRRVSTLYFWMDNHEHLSLRAAEQECVSLMNALRNSLDHCCFGYSLQKEQLYRADPALLRP
jgi:hypothetical protein